MDPAAPVRAVKAPADFTNWWTFALFCAAMLGMVVFFTAVMVAVIYP